MNKLKKLVLASSLLALGSCNTDANFRSYVMAHRLSHDAMAPQYTSYIDHDTSLSDLDKLSFKRRVDAEDQMITEAEKLLGIKL